MLERAKTLARSMVATSAATVTDLATLTLLVSLAHVSPRVASVPALLCAAVVSFVANRRFAFRVRGPENVQRQALVFAGVQTMTIALNALTFDLVMRALGTTTSPLPLHATRSPSRGQPFPKNPKPVPYPLDFSQS